MRNDFCAFILTHGRPNKVVTYQTLLKFGYTGKIYLVVDDEDKTLQQYIDKFGDKVLVFSKEEISKTFDEGDNFSHRIAITYARNMTFELAKKVGCKYFIQLDDDYTGFGYRYNKNNKFGWYPIKSLDEVFTLMLKYYVSIPALTVAMAQGGDYIGGRNGRYGKSIFASRKAMNSFICSTDRPFQFSGKMNEDVSTYTNLGRQGKLFLTLSGLMLSQIQTQSLEGGMTDIYREGGTYNKSFYSVMYCPSSVKVSVMQSTQQRIHHHVNWLNTTPMILRETHRKKTP